MPRRCVGAASEVGGRARITQAGFTMLEIVIAIAILGAVMAAAGPQMVGSIRASGTAKLISQAKGVLQGQLEAMRTLPFRVTPSAGDHRDLLDTYYRNRTGPSATPVCGTGAPAAPLATWSGFVSAANAARCSYEQQGGSMYRRVVVGGTGEIPVGFAVVLNTAFISAATVPAVVEPAANYDSQLASRDRPPSPQVGVTATVLYQDRGRWKPVTVYTQIASRTASATRIKLDARGSAIEIGSARPSGEAITLTGGQLDLAGSLSTTSQARANLAAMAAASSVTGRVEGAALSVQAPYTNLLNLNVSLGELESGCSGPCWGATAIPPFVLAAEDGLPRAGVSGIPGLLGPVQTQLPDNLTRDGFQFTAASTPTLADLSGALVSMDATPPAGTLLTSLVAGLHNCAFTLTGPLSHVSGSGFIEATDELALVDPLSAEACGGSSTNVVRILPTSHAPDGLIRVTVRSAAHCKVAGTAHVPSATASYRAEVEYWRWTPAVLDLFGIELIPGYGQYVGAGVISSASPGSALAEIPPGTQVGPTPALDPPTMSDYIESVSGVTAARVTTAAIGAVAEVVIPALVSIQTQPVVVGDEKTALSLALGSSYCRAEDNR
ncbi:MAG: type II secretion system protein [Sporichthyaceae bacterium]